MALETKPFDVAEFLDNDETIIAFLTEALETNDPPFIAQALGTVARAKGGMTQLAKDTGMSREALYRALGENGNPEFATIVKVLVALGVKLTPSMAA